MSGVIYADAATMPKEHNGMVRLDLIADDNAQPLILTRHAAHKIARNLLATLACMDAEDRSGVVVGFSSRGGAIRRRDK